MSLSVNGKNIKNIHFVGLFGVGMSSLAQFTKWLELCVTGSDRECDSPHVVDVKSKLESLGIVSFLQDGSGISEETDIVVVSTAIESSNADIAKAKSLRIPVVHRSDLLAEIIKTRKAVAVAGTSGKSTVTAMVFHILRECGMEPSMISGAALEALKSDGLIGNAFYGKSDILVVEADESDGSLVKYHPEISLFLNLSKDHKPIDEVFELFRELSSNSTFVIKNMDSAELLPLECDLTFSLENAAATVSSENVEYLNSESLGFIAGNRFKVPLPGKHNVENFLAAATVARKLGCNIKEIAFAIESYSGIGGRYQRVCDKDAVAVIYDYAHNPEKIKAAVTSLQTEENRIIAIFQPHGFKPTEFLFNEYCDAFIGCIRERDSVFFLPIFYAGGTVNRSVSSDDLADSVRKSGCSVFSVSRDAVLETLSSEVSKNQPCVVLLMGARDPSLPSFAEKICETLSNTVI